jgi:hypothetical protein
MIKRILPIYQTGWFYLIILFLGSSYSYISDGGLNIANQLNIDLLTQLVPKDTSSQNNSPLKDTNILTLQSSFNENDVDAIKRLITYYPDSQLVLLGKYAPVFMTRLEQYLASINRAQKVIVSSDRLYSGQALEIQSEMMLASTLDWLRYSAKEQIKKVNSKHFIYTPSQPKQRQSFSLLWQEGEQTYLTLPGEILKQLDQKDQLSLKRHWQLSLINTQNSIAVRSLPLGFLGEVFTDGKAYDINQDKLKNNYLEMAPLTSASQFIKQQGRILATKSSPHQYKVIIITDQSMSTYDEVKPLVIKLTEGDYLSQNILTVLLSWIVAIIGLALTWLIRHLPFKQQLIVIVSFAFALFILQCFKFNQQQWFEILPIIIVLSGSWLLLLAYQNECNLFLTALNNHNKPKEYSSAPIAVAPKKVIPNKTKQVYKSPQNFSPTATMAAVLASSPVEDLEQTLVLAEKPIKQKATLSHHLTVENFGRYQVEGILGKGAMGIVYQGVDPKINRHVAIKTLQLSDEVDSKEFTEAKERFFREAQTAGGLSHANIVTIYDVGEENNLGYIAMDLLTGAPLSLFTQPGQTLPVPLVYKLLMQITDALDYAHNLNVVHRDIKPANIIYDDDLFKVTVTDFGIAYVSDNSKTRTGIIMGSPYYMSPEQILGLKVDGRSDIFSLGVTFYQLLCGHLPFEGESIATVAYQITKAKPVSVNQHNTGLPASALRITNKAMHKDKDKRYQTMAEFKLALVNALKRDFKITAN